MSRLLVVLFSVLILTGCTAKLAYNNIKLITPWYVDDYIDLNREQQAIFDRHLQELHQWHREVELPQYRQIFSDLHQHLQQGQLDADLLRTKITHLRGHWNTLIEQTTPAVIELSRTLSDTQRQQFFEALEERNMKRLKRADTPAEHQREMVETIEKWMGPITKQQRAWVEAFAQANPDLTTETVAAHRAFQAELAILLSQNSMASFPSRVGGLLSNALGVSEEGRLLEALRQQQLEGRVELFQRLWSSASDNQKRKVRSRLKGYIDDIDDLITD